jgi:hypothetical protein
MNFVRLEKAGIIDTGLAKTSIIQNVESMGSSTAAATYNKYGELR